MHEMWFSCSTYPKWTRSNDLLLPTWLMAYDHEIEISTPYELDKQLDLLPNLPWLIDASIWQCCWDYAPQMYMSYLIIDLWLWKCSDTELALKIDLILQDCKDFWTISNWSCCRNAMTGYNNKQWTLWPMFHNADLEKARGDLRRGGRGTTAAAAPSG